MDDLHELAKVYAASYASPHHIIFTLDGLESLVAAISQESCIGESVEADFEKNTWTFKMRPGYSVGAGFYRISYIGLDAPKATP